MCILVMIVSFYATLIGVGGPWWDAGFSSLLANTQRGMILLGAGFNQNVGLESKFVRFGCLACLAFAAVVCYSYGFTLIMTISALSSQLPKLLNLIGE